MIDKPLYVAAADKIGEYRADYNNPPSNSIFSIISCLLLLAPLAAFTVV
jgi:hypothetical protein